MFTFDPTTTNYQYITHSLSSLIILFMYYLGLANVQFQRLKTLLYAVIKFSLINKDGGVYTCED